MEVYPIDKKTEQTFKEISRRIFRLQNGRSLDSMENVGADTTGQIGASYLSLKNLATRYPKDQRLAPVSYTHLIQRDYHEYPVIGGSL